jgi:ABC-type Fe3+ transport system permease subunit
MFLALWVFTVSGLIHTLVAWKTEPETELFNEVFFLLFSFAGGLVEYYFQHYARWVTQSGRRDTGWAEKLLGFCWVFVFFYCVSPPYQYSHVYADMLRRGSILGRASGIKITVDI